jgi:hypothetical protein
MGFALDDKQLGCAAVRDLALRAYDKLNGCMLGVIKSHQTTMVKTTPEQAQQFVELFFNGMLGTTVGRVRGLVGGAGAYNVSCKARQEGVGATAPLAIRQLFHSLSQIPEKGRPDMAKSLVYNLEVIKLRKAWVEICASLAALDPAGHELIAYLGLEPPKQGTTYVSQAKSTICNRSGITVAEFSFLLRNSTIPAALVEHFGPGSLLFCSSTIGS